MKKRILIGVVLAVTAIAAVAWAQTSVDPQLAQPRPPSTPWLAYITNWPDSQTVDGTVDVGNLPPVQDVSGSVEVSNLPAVQQVTGSVEVTNLPASSGPARYQYVGITTQTFDGSAGIGNFTLACQQDFPNARMCTSAEIISTTQWPPQPAVEFSAWVQPIYAPISGDTELVLDVSGQSHGDLSGISCRGWRTNLPTYQGLLLESRPAEGKYGSFWRQECDQTRPVACCAPVE
jgi:hypothetical protein